MKRKTRRIGKVKFTLPNVMQWVICVVLLLLPFFWIPPGTVDLGGDSTRLYFYDPGHYLQTVGLYGVLPSGTGGVVPSYFLIPFVALAWGVMRIVGSPYIVASLFSSIKLIGGFLAISAVVKRMVEDNQKKEVNNGVVKIASMTAGLFYIFSPAMISNYDKALITHNQVFLNPLMWYFFMKIVIDRSSIHLFLALIVSVLFSPNFSYSAAPPFFAFYPLSVVYLFVYARYKRISIPWRMIICGVCLFLALHAFHIVPEILQGFTAGTNVNARVFDKKDIAEQIGYFLGILPIPKLSLYFSSHAPFKELGWISFIIPLTVVVGFLVNRKQKVLALTGLFFLLAFFFVTAKVANIGVWIYTLLFSIPGFSMFRNFYGQWQFVYYFFYSLLFGQALYLVVRYFRRLYPYIVTVLVLYIVLSAQPFLNGSLVNQVHHLSKGVRIATQMDPKYEKILSFIRTIPNTGRILDLPFTDCCFQVVHGLNNGAYVGLSPIGNLTGKNDFAGYATIAPYSDIFWKLSKEKDYESIKKMLGLLNVRYVFYNSDPLIYDDTFPDYPYSKDYVRKYMPSNQQEYREYVENITTDTVFKTGTYTLYTTDEHFFLPRFYVPRQIILYDGNPNDSLYHKASSFFNLDTAGEIRSVFLNRETCRDILKRKYCDQVIYPLAEALPTIRFQQINPTKYRAEISNARQPYILVFSQEYHQPWKVFISPRSMYRKWENITSYFNGGIEESATRNVFFDSQAFETIGMKPIPNSVHFLANGYANAWYITPEEAGGRDHYELIIEMTGQRVFWESAAVSLIALMVLMGWCIIFAFSSFKTSDIIG